MSDRGEALASEDWAGFVSLPFSAALRLVRSAPPLPTEPDWLGARERATWRGLAARASPKRRTEWLNGRRALKEAVRAWLGVQALPLTGIDSCNDLRGRPWLRPMPGFPDRLPSVSIAHAGGLALALAGPPELDLGVDLEPLGRLGIGAEDFARISLAEGETLPTGPRWQETALRLWVAKEAAAKALGHGLMGRPRAFRVRDGGENRVVHGGREVPFARFRVGEVVGAVAWLRRAPISALGERCYDAEDDSIKGE